MSVHLQRTHNASYHRNKGTLSERFTGAGYHFRHTNHLFYTFNSINSSHDVLAGVIQPGKKPVYIHLFNR
ncbi:hypothetical protein ES703_47810 [subsurface metagenome]